jgi:hypothetical protein
VTVAFTVQQTNRTTELIAALKAVKDAYYNALEVKDAANLIGIPADADFPAPGDIDHVTRNRLRYAHLVVDAFKAWMTTAIDMDGAGGLGAKVPLDAIVEMLR